MNVSADLPPTDAASALRDLLRADLMTAMKARQAETVAVLRMLIAAIDNAQAVATSATPDAASDANAGAQIAGAAAGVGATEVPRRMLSAADLRALLQRQIDERMSAAEKYEALEVQDAAQLLRREADLLRTYLATVGVRRPG